MAKIVAGFHYTEERIINENLFENFYSTLLSCNNFVKYLCGLWQILWV